MMQQQFPFQPQPQLGGATSALKQLLLNFTSQPTIPSGQVQLGASSSTSSSAGMKLKAAMRGVLRKTDKKLSTDGKHSLAHHADTVAGRALHQWATWSKQSALRHEQLAACLPVMRQCLPSTCADVTHLHGHLTVCTGPQPLSSKSTGSSTYCSKRTELFHNDW